MKNIFWLFHKVCKVTMDHPIIKRRAFELSQIIPPYIKSFLINPLTLYSLHSFHNFTECKWMLQQNMFRSYILTSFIRLIKEMCFAFVCMWASIVQQTIPRNINANVFLENFAAVLRKYHKMGNKLWKYFYTHTRVLCWW